MSPFSSEGADEKKSLVEALVPVLITLIKKGLKLHFPCLLIATFKRLCHIFHRKSHFFECK